MNNWTQLPIMLITYWITNISPPIWLINFEYLELGGFFFKLISKIQNSLQQKVVFIDKLADILTKISHFIP